MRKAIALAVILMLVVSLSGCSSSQSSGGQGETRDYFKVGVITSLSGDEVYGGNVTRRGYDLWAETVNAKGGIQIGDKKYPVKMVYADDQSQPAAGADAVQRMITQEKVDFILGPYTSGVTIAVAPILEKYKVPMITGSAESPKIWRQKFKYTFGDIPAVDLTGSAPLATLASMNPKPTKIAIIGVNDTFSQATAEAFREAAKKYGIEVVKYDIVPPGTDFTPLVSAVKALNPDILAVGGHEKEHMEIIKASKSLNFMPKAFLMHYGITTPDFTKNLGKDGDYVIGAAVWTPDMNLKDPLFGDTKGYLEKSKARWGSLPDYTEAASTAAGEVFEAALAKLGAKPPLSEKDREALVTALEQVQVDTFYGPIKFATEGNWYHDNVGLTPLTIQMKGGEQLVVGPGNLKKADLKYPIPGWKER